MGEQLFQYYLFGIYIIELGNFFKGTFDNFKISPGGEDLTAQVYFGTPRAAFRYYMDRYNGQIKLPMINYYFSGSPTRKTEYEKIVYLTSKDSYNPETGKANIMRFPSVFELEYTVNFWNNDFRERDYMMHAMINSFPMGEAWLFHYPDKVNHPKLFLPMAHSLSLEFTDETQVDDLSPEETRDRIRTSMTIKCTRAFVPYQVYEIDVAQWVNLSSYINETLGQTKDNEVETTFGAVKNSLLKIGSIAAGTN